jgi:hypothetical protein
LFLCAVFGKIKIALLMFFLSDSLSAHALGFAIQCGNATISAKYHPKSDYLHSFHFKFPNDEFEEKRREKRSQKGAKGEFGKNKKQKRRDAEASSCARKRHSKQQGDG